MTRTEKSETPLLPRRTERDLCIGAPRPNGMSVPIALCRKMKIVKFLERRNEMFFFVAHAHAPELAVFRNWNCRLPQLETVWPDCF